MCLVHDLAEALIGDITPHCGVGEKEKQATELTAMQAISAAPAEKAGSEMLSLFQVNSQTNLLTFFLVHWHNISLVFILVGLRIFISSFFLQILILVKTTYIYICVRDVNIFSNASSELTILLYFGSN